MDKSTKSWVGTFREVLFRTPSRMEQALGLWVDRVGEGGTRSMPYGGRLRILGQYCHVAVLRGRGEYISLSAGRQQVEAGDVMVQMPDDPCLYYPDGEWVTCWVTWNGPEGRLLEESGCIRAGVLKNVGGIVSLVNHQLQPLMANATVSSALRRKALILELLHELLEATGTDAGNVRDPVQTALVALHRGYNRRVDLEDLTNRVGLSLTHFRRLFRLATGRSPMQYVRDLRMAEARRLLREGKSIKVVAAHVGYTDVFHFMRVFKAENGCPPGVFAKGSLTGR